LIEIEVKLGNPESFREQALPLPFARWFFISSPESIRGRRLLLLSVQPQLRQLELDNMIYAIASGSARGKT